MTTEQKSYEWIQNSVLNEIGHDMVMALGVVDYHRYSFHEAELLEDGILRPGEGFARVRRSRIEAFESNFPELANKIKIEHDKLPAHKFEAEK